MFVLSIIFLISLASSGTRTVRLSGHARQITIHVFDPRIVEELLDRGVIEKGREEDVIAKAENRRQVAYRAMLTRSLKKGAKKGRSKPEGAETVPELRGWEEFDLDRLLQ